MNRRASIVFLAIGCGLGACASGGGERGGRAQGDVLANGARLSAVEPLVIGETFTIESGVMGESRRVNVMVPTVYGEKIREPLPVLYMLDGGVDEDFLHIAGLVQILVSSGTMRPFMLVGIPNTQRRRDLSGPTANEEDKKMAAVVGGSAVFRRFIKEELMPAVRRRYRTTEEAAIVGESLAGLFVLETLMVEPGLFREYIAIDPSLWWNDAGLVKSAGERIGAGLGAGKSVFVASSNEPDMTRLAAELAREFESHRAEGVEFLYVPFPEESHATIYHPAAFAAFRRMFAPPAEQKANGG